MKETIAVRNMPAGTKAALAQLAETHGRSLEAEVRHVIKQYLSNHANLAERQAPAQIESGGNHWILASDEARIAEWITTALRLADEYAMLYDNHLSVADGVEQTKAARAALATHLATQPVN